MSRVEDPGWRSALLGGLFILIPTVGARRAFNATNGLVLMRQLWSAFVTAMVLIGIVAMVLDRSLKTGDIDGRVVAGVIVVGGVVAQLIGARYLSEISGETNEEARASAQSRFFLRVALAEPVALAGFVGFILTANLGVYAASFVVALAGMLDARPSAAWIDRGQRQLQAQGSNVHLLAALTQGGITR